MLTDLKIKSLKPAAKQYRVTDSHGLGIEVMPSGKKSWRYRFRLNGKAQNSTLGHYPRMGLSEARKARDNERDMVALGKHPTREKRAEKLRRMADGENTFEAVCRKMLENKAKGFTPKYQKQVLARMEQRVFPYIGALPVTETTPPDVVRVIERIGHKHGTIVTAHRMKQVIAQTFRYAIQRGLCLYNPASDLRGILPPSDEVHYGCIRPDELPDLLKAMQGYNGDRLVKLALQLIALTFVRTGELIAAKWEEIDWGRQEWYIPKERMKMRRPHVVPLSNQAVAVLEELRALTGTKENIFHSQRSRKIRHISNGAILMALRRMGYANRMTGHGFRTLASTILNEKGFKPDVIERQLAHEDKDKVRSAYNRAEYLLERKAMMQFYAGYLDASLKNNDNIVSADFKARAS